MDLNDILTKNSRLKQLHAGKRCFIIGNGPSSSKHDISRLASDVTMVVGSFHLHPQAKQLQPDYWLMADDLAWQEPIRHYLPIVNGINERGINTKLFLDARGLNVFLKQDVGPLIDRHYFCYGPTAPLLEQPLDFAGPIPQLGHSPIALSLMLAFYLRCDPIYLVGCDGDEMGIDQKRTTETSSAYAFACDYGERHGFHIFDASESGLGAFTQVPYASLFPVEGPSFATEPLPARQLPARRLAKVAMQLLDADNVEVALCLLDNAAAQNTGHAQRVEGIDYLRALGLAKLGRYEAALACAHRDHVSNLAGRARSQKLIEQLAAQSKSRSIVLETTC